MGNVNSLWSPRFAKTKPEADKIPKYNESGKLTSNTASSSDSGDIVVNKDYLNSEINPLKDGSAIKKISLNQLDGTLSLDGEVTGSALLTPNNTSLNNAKITITTSLNNNATIDKDISSNDSDYQVANKKYVLDNRISYRSTSTSSTSNHRILFSSNTSPSKGDVVLYDTKLNYIPKTGTLKADVIQVNNIKFNTKQIPFNERDVTIRHSTVDNPYSNNPAVIDYLIIDAANKSGLILRSDDIMRLESEKGGVAVLGTKSTIRSRSHNPNTGELYGDGGTAAALLHYGGTVFNNEDNVLSNVVAAHVNETTQDSQGNYIKTGIKGGLVRLQAWDNSVVNADGTTGKEGSTFSARRAYFDMYGYDDGSNNGSSIYISAGTTFFSGIIKNGNGSVTYHSSDRSVKENINKYDTSIAYDTIKDIPIYTFTYKTDNDKSDVYDRTTIGTTIENMPNELICKDGTMYDTVGSGFMTMAALQEAQKKIEALELKVKELEDKLNGN